MTSLRVSTELRDKIRDGAQRHRETQAEYIARALRELEQAEFLRAVAAERYDDEDLDEATDWLDADLTSGPTG
ncbi:hypothetical protein GCM10023216_10000 [Isoptericola chiayiensis]|uniref:CopG family transcriptional regulator n=2 Tax=Isoptericola chiayiensis TaxID=579446 RepID=A0ABP8Y7I9_9MICO